MNANLSIVTAFAAGLLSFVSPCVLPLFGSYLAFITGLESGRGGTDTDRYAVSLYRRKVVVSTLFFVLGFSVVFTGFSVLLYGFMFFLGGVNRWVNGVAGIIVIVLGLNILFNFIPFLKYDDSGNRCATCTPKHSILAAGEGAFLHPANRPKGWLGAFLAGLAFGAGWTPCAGAFLGSILLLAGQSGTLGLSIAYLAAYSAGLGVPFLATGFFWGILAGRIQNFTKAMRPIRIISGCFLIVTGALMAFGRLVLLNGFLQRAGFAVSEWAQSGGASVRLVPAGIFLVCAFIPAVVRLFKKRTRGNTAPPPGIGMVVWQFALTLLALANGTGLINCAEFLAHRLAFGGFV
jgi:cytochrome c-type biogenesis protein